MMKHIFLIVLLATSMFSVTYAQGGGEDPLSFFSFNIAYSVKDDLLPEGIDYSPVVFLASFPVYQKGHWSVYSELQFAKALQGITPQSEWEGGMNFGLMYHIPLSEKLRLTIAMGTGPYFISLHTSRQSRGFIFSDNLELGFVYPISKKHLDFNVKARYRHISNAGFNEPNGGIDNLFFVLGVTKHFF